MFIVATYMDHHLTARAILWHNYEYSMYLLYSHASLHVLIVLRIDGQTCHYELQGKTLAYI